MPKSKVKEVPKEIGEVIAYTEIKEQVRAKIIEKFGNINKFAYSDVAIKICKVLNIKPEYIKMYMTPKGPTSFPVMQHLYNQLELGNLEKNVTVVKTTTYYKV